MKEKSSGRGVYGVLGAVITKEGNLQRGNLGFVKTVGDRVGQATSDAYKHAPRIDTSVLNRKGSLERNFRAGQAAKQKEANRKTITGALSGQRGMSYGIKF